MAVLLYAFHEKPHETHTQEETVIGDADRETGSGERISCREGLDKASEMLERWYPSLYNYRAFGESNQRRLRTTNVLERLNLEFKRRTKKVGAFPSEQSLMRLIVFIMMDINEEWITGRIYMNMEVN